MFRISGSFEKAGQDRLLPMSLEFAKLLDTVPPEDRYGPVFNLIGGRGQSAPHWSDDLADRSGGGNCGLARPAHRRAQEARDGSRPETCFRLPLVQTGDASGAHGTHAAREDRDDDEVLRRPERRSDGGRNLERFR
jgi:hypothetical protein